MKPKIIFKLNEETELPEEVIQDAPQSGPFDGYAEYLLETYDVECTLSDSIKYLTTVGAWDDSELQDLETNKARLLWIACADCQESDTQLFYMGDWYELHDQN